MDDSNEINLSMSGDENKTILLDETIDKPNESSTESDQDVNKQSAGSLKAVDISDLIEDADHLKTKSSDNGDDFVIEDPKPKLAAADKQDDNASTDVKRPSSSVKDDDEPALEMVNFSSDVLDEEDVEETVLERLIGLTEMFPDTVRNVGHSVLTGTIPLISKTFNYTRNFGWIFFSSFAILVVPVSLEKERCQTQRDLDRQMLLGAGKSSSGLGMAPSPVSK